MRVLALCVLALVLASGAEATRTKLLGKRVLASEITAEYSYNWVEGDWSVCTATCGDSVSTRTVTCVNAASGVLVDTSNCDAATMPSTTSDCALCACPVYKYKLSDWSGCSATCGSGYQTLTAECWEQNRGIQVDVHFCELAEGSITTQKSCENLPECPKPYWVDIPGQCDVTCGTGLNVHTVMCMFKGVVVEDSQCTEPKPPTAVACDVGICEEWQWVVGEFSECMASSYGGNPKCEGYRLRDVRCLSNIRGYVSLVECAPLGTAPSDRDTTECISECAPDCKEGDWSVCSATCGDGFQTRALTCTDYWGVPLSYVPAAFSSIITSTTCFLKACPTYEWKYGEYDLCSAECGEGSHTRSVWCQSSEGDVVDASYCEGQTAPVSEAVCNLKPCVYWYAGEFTCPVTCGAGVATREVYCALKDTTTKVAPEFCATEGEAPASAQSCEAAVKCIEPYWAVISFGACSTTCGEGSKIATIGCFDANTNQQIDDIFCAAIEPPASVKSCNEGACDWFEWEVPGWGDCSVSCGVGMKYRDVYCESQLLGVRVDDAYCTEEKPKVEMMCSISDCGYSWFACEWGDCSVTCGFGSASREVYCADYKGYEVADELCASITKPAESRVCGMSECGADYHWTRGSWSTCSVTCGQGMLERKVQCVDAEGVEADSDLCIGEKPTVAATCWQDVC